MELNKQTIDAYRELLTNPEKHGLPFKALAECFKASDKITAKHIIYGQFINYLKKPLPKVIFYIIMDELFGCDGKDEKGDLGYKLYLCVG
jgi:hypothetical protein